VYEDLPCSLSRKHRSVSEEDELYGQEWYFDPLQASGLERKQIRGDSPRSGKQGSGRSVEAEGDYHKTRIESRAGNNGGNGEEDVDSPIQSFHERTDDDRQFLTT